MSTFGGELKEIPDISIDHFVNKSCKYYFLSHCHSDHLRGISNLAECDAPLYTTHLSSLIIKRRYPSINVQVLELGYPTPMEFVCEEDGKRTNFVVTSLNAGHCLGACMFLFQIEGLDILYTGDFRISLKNAQNIKVLREVKEYGNLIVYCDTTFLNESYKDFPKQSESCDKVVEVISQHLKASSSNKVNLRTSSRYGYERLLIELNTRLNEQIFIIEQEVREQYFLINQLASCITTDKQKSRIHLKPTYLSRNKKSENDRNQLNIQLSAMYWADWKKSDSIVHEMDTKKSLRICYATHNSATEIRDFLIYLKPKIINASVVPESYLEKQKMLKLIDEIMHVYKEISTNDEQPKKRFSFKRIRSRNLNNEETLESKKIKL